MSSDRSSPRALRSSKLNAATIGATRLITFAVPGLAAQLAAELESLPGVRVQDSGFDGRSDVVLFTADGSTLQDLLAVRLAEDVLVAIGRTLRSEGDRAQWIAGRLWRPGRVRRALTARARMGRPVRERGTFRVITRVLQERSFQRTDLRRRVVDAIHRQQPQWRLADPAEVEVWVVEYRPGKFVAGLRGSDIQMRQHQGREVERSGALRPTVAAAMVRLAGKPAELLLDPCCGSGTILAEATEVGWGAAGTDIDPDAVRIARKNAPGASIEQGDVRQLPFQERSVDACVSNLPFGQQYSVQGGMQRWLQAALAELGRVTRSGGRVVLLAPSIAGAVLPAGLRLRERIPIRLLGTKTTIWAYDRQ